jgi:hypothetical protein
MNDVGFIAAVALGFTFLASGVGKLRDHEGFVLAVLDYEVLPPPPRCRVWAHTTAGRGDMWAGSSHRADAHGKWNRSSSYACQLSGQRSG